MHGRSRLDIASCPKPRSLSAPPRFGLKLGAGALFINRPGVLPIAGVFLGFRY